MAAALVLVRLDDTVGAQVLTRFVQPGAAEREEVLRTTEKLKMAAIAPYLKMIATSGATDERLRAVEALGRQDAAAAAEALCVVARSADNGQVRMAAVVALGRVDGDLSTYLLRSLLRDDVAADVQLEAASVLGERGVDAAAPVLRKAVASNNVKAARALCKIGDASGSKVYEKMLGSTDLRERIEAAVVLYKLQVRAPLSMGS